MFSWEMLWALGVLILGGAFIYGMVQYYSRNKTNDRITEEATREQYQNPDAYDDDRRKELEKDVRPG